MKSVSKKNNVCNALDDYEYRFYAVTTKNKLVYGFDDEMEAKNYSKKNDFKVFTRNGLKNKKINPAVINSWTDEFPEYAE